MQPVNSDGLKWLVEKVVSINRDGPESKKGWLVNVKDDHLVLQTEEQYLYYQTKHVKSITVDSTVPLEATIPFDKKLVYWDALSFNDILEKMIFRRVQINQGGPESIDGILSRLFENHVDLIQGHEVIKVATPHIKNVSYILSNQDANSNSKKGSQTEDMANEMKEQTIVQETNQAEVEQKPQKRRRRRSEKKEVPPIQELKSIDHANIHPDQASDSIKGDELADALPIMTNDQNQVITEQIVEIPSQDRSLFHNPVSNNVEALFYLPVVKKIAKKASALGSRKSKLIKLKRKAIRPILPQRKRKMKMPKSLKVSKIRKKINKKIKIAKRIKVTTKIKVTKRWLFLSEKRQPSKAVILGSVWLAPSVKMYIPR